MFYIYVLYLPPCTYHARVSRAIYLREIRSQLPLEHVLIFIQKRSRAEDHFFFWWNVKPFSIELRASLVHFSFENRALSAN